MEIIDMLAREVGFENPLKEDLTRNCSLMLVHESSCEDKPAMSGGFYPYIVGLQYQIRSQKYSLLSDSGWVAVEPRIDSVMVTVGDIAQVSFWKFMVGIFLLLYFKYLYKHCLLFFLLFYGM